MTTDSKKYSTYDEFMECVTDTLGKRKTKFVAHMGGGKEPTYTKEELQLMREGIEKERKEREALQKLATGKPVPHTQIGAPQRAQLEKKQAQVMNIGGGRLAFTYNSNEED